MNMDDKGKVLLYQTADGATKIEVTLKGETVWLNLDQMAELFQRNKSTISRHVKSVFESGELSRDSVVAFSATTAADGKSYKVAYYNLDMIISVGYRVNSHRGVQFRMWATQVLREYLVKGFALNDELLKRAGGGNYFDELQAESHTPMYMSDWIAKLDEFLKLSNRQLLKHAGTISAEVANLKANSEYDRFRDRVKNELTPVELHFIENFERERKRLDGGRGKSEGEGK